MTPAETERYPELRQLCGAYLNADFPDEYGSVVEALRAYRDDTSSAHRLGALRELERLIAAAPTDAAIGDELVALGCDVYFATGSDARVVADEMRRALAD